MGADEAAAAIGRRHGRPPRGDHRTVMQGIADRHRAGIARRDLPRQTLEPWQTVRKQHEGLAEEATWDRVVAVGSAGRARCARELMTEADAPGRSTGECQRTRRPSGLTRTRRARPASIETQRLRRITTNLPTALAVNLHVAASDSRDAFAASAIDIPAKSGQVASSAGLCGRSSMSRSVDRSRTSAGSKVRRLRVPVPSMRRRLAWVRPGSPQPAGIERGTGAASRHQLPTRAPPVE